MLPQSKKGFTLIELLVVITIIGILAVWAVSVYTSQIQKARDTTRLNDIKALQSWVEQVYQDGSSYPAADNTFSTWVAVYVPRLPSDPKNWELCNKWDIWASNATPCEYIYEVWPDKNSIIRWQYEISTWFENSWNISAKAAKDWWNDNSRYEVWLEIDTNDSWCVVNNRISKVTWTYTDATTCPTRANNSWWADDGAIFVAWN